uniref:Peptidase_M13 domain-containing protein n=1 Tax=Globodera pallida TaxID=36090 RepID=A0A183CJU8_GLOPA
MSPRAKSSAHNKLDKIVANIGWPQIMVNNSELEQYYKPLVFTDNENFVNIWEKGMKFAYTRQWQHLLKRHGTDRTEFNEQIILVNAWYQPELNSITVPASILSQPFFDREWPDFINYGTIGAVLGHELSHGFDNFGVQWDSDGSAIKWLDARSQLAFDRMAKCLVDEYSQLCPFPRDGRIQPACIDGNKTQGENIADNGGLHAAFRAYRSALEVDGPSKALPGDLIGRFSPDQLFFMSFAQPWCEEPNEFETFLQLMDDTHSPAKFRVLGSLRNFPAFRDSFNCPLNSKYAPEKHCDVWVSSVTEKPIAAPPANLLNVPTAQMARADDEEFAAYKSAVQYFKNSMNLASDPCNNFYEYACANYRGPTGFAVKQNDNYKRIATAIEQMEPKPDSALEKLKQFFTACTSTLPQLDALILDGAVLRARLDRFIAFTNMDFPLFSVRSSFDMPNGDTLARALAWLSAREGVDTLVTPFVDVELAPSEEGQKGPQNYRLFLDQNTLAFRKSYYQPGTWELIREKYATNAKTLLRRVGHVLGKATDEKVLEEAVQGLLELELRLAREFSTDEEKRMDVGRWAHTLETLDNANRVVPLLDWNTYVKQLTKLSGVNLGDPKKKQFAYFIEGNMMGKLSDALTKKEKDGREVGAVQLANYLFFRLLLQNTKEEEEHFLVDQPPLIGGGWRNRRLFQRARWAMEDPFRPIMARRTDGVETICAAQSSNLLGMASARVFADLLYPGGQKQREELRKSVSRMVNGVHHSYRAMLDELDWLDGATRGEAMAKLDQLRVNIGSPDWIHSDGELDSFFDALNFENATDYFNSLDQLTTFNNFLQFRLLQEDKFKVNRNEFMGLPTDVNAWYIPELNSITFPDGILQRPFFDPQWPAAVNYGTLGSIAGHEISHAFDDDGVQWNSEGFLKRWMGDESQKDFDQMAKCVVGEYGAIEVLDPAKYRPSNISGLRTQGENIADNAGIIAAFRAFKLHSALNGPEPRLPDQSLSGLSADQLFFLSFAQNWCQSPPSENELFRQILVDPHSPSKVRVLGTLRNFPAFREAFNCRANSFYAAKKPCHVWVPEMPDF